MKQKNSSFRYQNKFRLKTIEHFYGADLDWVSHFAEQIGGKVDGNFIIVPEDLQSGTRYFLDCNDGIIAYFIDVEYKSNFQLIQKNSKNDFVGLYYNLTDGEANISVGDFSYNVTRWHYNVTVLDGTLETSYNVKAGSKTFALCIFIKKSVIKSYARKNNIVFRNLDQIIDPAKNTVVRFDRMSNESFHLLDDLRKLTVGGPVFNLNLIGTVHMLLSNYLKKMASNRIIIQTINQDDLNNIIGVQMYLIQNIEDNFPSISQMASRANMSESKFKSLFKKITGNTPSAFFMDNKLLLAKDLLEKKQYSISQISDKLNFTNNSYFASKFKQQFGMSPMAFIKQL